MQNSIALAAMLLPFLGQGSQDQSASYFRDLFDAQREIVNWPMGVERPLGFRKYKPAEYTQSIAVVNGRDSIERVHRSNLLMKWQVPGGLEHSPRDAWRSDLYVKKMDEGVWSWVDNIPVWNGSNFQYNRGWVREFADGMQFMDVLTNAESGKVFEVRLATKKDGEWTRIIDYTNRQERPEGYVRPRARDCRSCHNEAGSGGYNSGMVPGGDTIISYPFAELK